VAHYENGDPRNIPQHRRRQDLVEAEFTAAVQWDGNPSPSRERSHRFLIGECTYDVHCYGYQGMSTDRYLKLTTDGGASFTNARGSGTIHMWGGEIYGGNA